MGGLPYYLTEEQCRELLGAFGPIKSFDLIRDRETGQSKGYGFCVYEDPRVTDIACSGMHGMRMGDRALTVRRAGEGRGEAPAAPQAAYVPPRVVKLVEAGGAGGGAGGWGVLGGWCITLPACSDACLLRLSPHRPCARPPAVQ